jgi:hypothetical protein
MVASAIKIHDLESLREYVCETLCRQDQLVVGAFPFTERILMRGGKPCGMYFCLHGPRSVKLSAIWDAANHTLLFYSSSGERFLKARLVESLGLALAAA